jgi:hypothetical protein
MREIAQTFHEVPVEPFLCLTAQTFNLLLALTDPSAETQPDKSKSHCY